MRDVSVVIPAFNADWCVGRAIESVLAQTHAVREVIVIDDGSTDDTAAVASRFGGVVRVVRQANGGLSAARNRGILESCSEWVAFLDADDVWYEGKLAAQSAAVAATAGAEWVFCDAEVVDSQGRVLEPWCFPDGIKTRGQLLDRLFCRNVVAGSGSGVVARRACLMAVGGFDESLRSVEDLDMWMRLASRYRFAHASGVHVAITRHGSNMSRNVAVMRRCLLAVRVKNRGLLGSGVLAGRAWNRAYAGVLCDTGKTSLRHRMGWQGVRDLLESMLRSPLGWGPVCAGVLVGWLTGRWPGRAEAVR